MFELEEKCDEYLFKGKAIELDDYLSDMEINKESKEKLIKAIKNYVVDLLYIKLLVDFKDLLTEEEYNKYRKKFFDNFVFDEEVLR